MLAIVLDHDNLELDDPRLARFDRLRPEESLHELALLKFDTSEFGYPGQ